MNMTFKEKFKKEFKDFPWLRFIVVALVCGIIICTLVAIPLAVAFGSVSAKVYADEYALPYRPNVNDNNVYINDNLYNQTDDPYFVPQTTISAESLTMPNVTDLVYQWDLTYEQIYDYRLMPINTATLNSIKINLGTEQGYYVDNGTQSSTLQTFNMTKVASVGFYDDSYYDYYPTAVFYAFPTVYQDTTITALPNMYDLYVIEYYYTLGEESGAPEGEITSIYYYPTCFVYESGIFNYCFSTVDNAEGYSCFVPTITLGFNQNFSGSYPVVSYGRANATVSTDPYDVLTTMTTLYWRDFSSFFNYDDFTGGKSYIIRVYGPNNAFTSSYRNPDEYADELPVYDFYKSFFEGALNYNYINLIGTQLDTAYNDGVSAGYTQGFNAGRTQGYSQGLIDGTVAGREQAKEDLNLSALETVAYQRGYQDGLRVGSAGGGLGFVSLFTSVADSQLALLTGFLDFNFLGFNMLTFFKSVLTICIVILFVKLILGGE